MPTSRSWMQLYHKAPFLSLSAWRYFIKRLTQKYGLYVDFGERKWLLLKLKLPTTIYLYTEEATPYYFLFFEWIIKFIWKNTLSRLCLAKDADEKTSKSIVKWKSK
jgi:hypothetical protein